jgi:hypothetical protein
VNHFRVVLQNGARGAAQCNSSAVRKNQPESQSRRASVLPLRRAACVPHKTDFAQPLVRFIGQNPVLLKTERNSMPRKTLFVVGLVFALATAAFLVRSWLEAHDDRLALHATLEAQKQIIAAADQREQQRAAALQTSLAEIAALKRDVRTPQQIVHELPQYLPLPAPIQLVQPQSVQQGTGSQPEKGTALAEKPVPRGIPPNGADLAPGLAAEFPAEDLKPLFDFVQDCRACQAQLASAHSDLADERAKSAVLEKERDAAIRAAKGGSLWTRVKRNAKWLAIGTAIGALATHHRL